MSSFIDSVQSKLSLSPKLNFAKLTANKAARRARNNDIARILSSDDQQSSSYTPSGITSKLPEQGCGLTVGTIFETNDERGMEATPQTLVRQKNTRNLFSLS